MLDLTSIRAEIAELLRADVDVAGAVTVYDHLHASPAMPAIHVCGPAGSITYRDTYAGTSAVTLKLVLEVARENFESAQRQLDRWLSTPGPLERLELAAGAAFTDLLVTSVSEPRSLGDPAAGEIASLAVDILVDVNT